MPISEVVVDNEIIVRSIFSPFCIDKKGNLKSNAFKSPSDKDEVSVLRLDYTTPDFCKIHSRKIESEGKKYIGLAVLTAKEIYSLGANFAYTPTEELPMHVDIVIGYKTLKFEPLPPEFSFKIIKMAELARLYIDKHLDNNKWLDGNLL